MSADQIAQLLATKLAQRSRNLTEAFRSTPTGAVHGENTYETGRSASSGTQRFTYFPDGSREAPASGRMTKFHWSMPDRPAFCHIIELIARSASTRQSWNHAIP